MASEVALLITLGCNANKEIDVNLKQLGYSTIQASSKHLPQFDIAIVLIGNNEHLPSNYTNTLKWKPTIFITSATNISIQPEIQSKAIITTNYTLKELELAIKLAKAETKQASIESILEKDNTSSAGINKLIIEQGSMGIVYIKNGIIAYANPYIKRILNYSTVDVIGNPYTQFLNVNERNLLMNRLQNRLGGKEEPTTYETALTKANGDSISVEISSNLFRLHDEIITIIFIKDITYKKNNEKLIKENNENFRGIFNCANYAIYILDMTGIILDANIAGLNLLQLSKQELAGLTINNFIEEKFDDPKDFTKSIRLAFQGSKQAFELNIINHSGDLIPADITLGKGKYYGMDVIIAMVHDISKRKNAENTLKESEEKYRSLTEQLSLGLIRLQTDGEIIYSNAAFANMVAISSAQDIVGKNIVTFTNGDEIGKTLQIMTSKKGEQTIETSIRQTSGNNIWVKLIISPIYSPLKKILYYNCIIESINELKQASDTLKERESRLNAMLAAVPDQLYSINGQLELIDYKLAFYGNYPKVNKSHIGSSLSKLVNADTLNKIHEAIEKCKGTKKSQEFEYHTSYKGQELYYELRIVPSSMGTYLMLQRDVTRRKEVEDRARMLAQAVRTTELSISISKLDGTIIYVNPAFCNTYGFTENEIIGKDVSLIRTPDFNPTLSKNIDFETTKNGWKGELINIRRDGSVFPVFLSTSIVYDENEKPKLMVGIARNISEQKRSEREIVRAKERAEEADRLKTAFLSNLSHEIRTPMNTVLGFVQLIETEEKLSEAGQQHIKLIKSGGKQLISLIDDIIDVSKIQTNQIKLSITSFNLNQLLNNLYADFDEQIRQNRPEISINPPHTPDDTQFNIDSDYTHIRQIISALLRNAIKFTPKGHIDFGYSLIVDDYSPKIQFFVKDTGIGISSDKQMLIFDLFRQGDDSFTRTYGGSGIGLTIAKGLVEMLGGNIWVESEVSAGAKFNFTIPYTNTKNSRMEHGLPALMLIEEPEYIKLYNDELFPRINARILLATNADEGRRLFVQDGNVKVVIIDTKTLDNDSYKIINDFKRAKPDVKIIAQTQIALEDELSMSTVSGCDEYIVKSRNIDSLLSKITYYLDNK